MTPRLPRPRRALTSTMANAVVARLLGPRPHDNGVDLLRRDEVPPAASWRIGRMLTSSSTIWSRRRRSACSRLSMPPLARMYPGMSSAAMPRRTASSRAMASMCRRCPSSLRRTGRGRPRAGGDPASTRDRTRAGNRRRSYPSPQRPRGPPGPRRRRPPACSYRALRMRDSRPLMTPLAGFCQARELAVAQQSRENLSYSSGARSDLWTHRFSSSATMIIALTHDDLPRRRSRSVTARVRTPRSSSGDTAVGAL